MKLHSKYWLQYSLFFCCFVLFLACFSFKGHSESAEELVKDGFDTFTEDIQFSDVELTLLEENTPELSEHTHEGGAADCIHRAQCTICQIEYGDFGGHSWSEGGCLVCQAQSVAGNAAGDMFTDFPSAWDNAISSGNVIILYSDVVCNNSLMLPGGCSIVLDLNGHALYFSANADFQGKFSAKNGSLVFERMNVNELDIQDCVLSAKYIYAEGGVYGNADIRVSGDFFSPADIFCKTICVDGMLETFASICCEELNANAVGAGKNIDCSGSITAPFDVNVIENLTCYSISSTAVGVGGEFHCKGDVVAESTVTLGGSAFCGNIYAGEAVNAADSIVCSNLDAAELNVFGNLMCDNLRISGESSISGNLVCESFSTSGAVTMKDAEMKCNILQNSGSITLTRVNADCADVHNTGTFIVNSTSFQNGNVFSNAGSGQLKLAGLVILPCVLNQGSISIYTRPALENGSSICLFVDIPCLSSASIPITRLTAENVGYFSVCSNGRIVSTWLEHDGYLSASAAHEWDSESGSCQVCETICAHTFDNGVCSYCGHRHNPQVLPEKAPGCETGGLTAGSVCVGCGAVLQAQEQVAPLGHSPIVLPAIEPSCTGQGYTEGEGCSACDTIFVAQFVIPPTGHKEETIRSVEASCTSAGLTEGKKCIICGDITVPQLLLPMAEHALETVIGYPATCESSGLTDGKRCSVCGRIFEAQYVIAPLDHQIIVIDGVSATCLMPGTTDGKKCLLCGEILLPQETVPALGHIPLELPGQIPTCVLSGYTRGEECAVCGLEILPQEELAPLGHIPVELPGKAATCTDTGYSAGTICSVCDIVLEAQEALDPLPHTPIKEAGREATCTESGFTAGAHCGQCGMQLLVSEELAPLGHTPEELPGKAATCTDSGYTVGTKCSVCGIVLMPQEKLDPLPHARVEESGREATCTESGFTAGAHCEQCGIQLLVSEELAPLGHSPVELPGKAATCTKQGYTARIECLVCNAVLKAQDEIPEIGHTIVELQGKEATCTEPGFQPESICMVCSEIIRPQVTIPELGHSPVEIVNKEPTCVSDGLTSGTICSRCDEWLHPQERIPAVGHTDLDGDGFCDICLIDFSVYKIIEGADSHWKLGSTTSLFFRSDAKYKKFIELKIDTTVVPSNAYRVFSGSTIVEVSASYLNLLNAGLHTLTICSIDGNASAQFYIDVEEFTVTFDTNFRDLDITEQKVFLGDYAREPEKPRRDGYVFAGWFCDDAFSVPFDFSVPISSDQILFAKWNLISPVPKTGDEMDIAPWIVLILIASIILTVMQLIHPKKKRRK